MGAEHTRPCSCCGVLGVSSECDGKPWGCSDQRTLTFPVAAVLTVDCREQGWRWGDGRRQCRNPGERRQALDGFWSQSQAITGQMGSGGVRERGVKDGSQVSGQVTGRKGLAKHRGGAGVGVNGNGEFSLAVCDICLTR